ESLAALVAEGLRDDALLLSGGVSAGKLDLVPAVLREAGVVAHFHKVAMKPGKPVLFGTGPRGQPVFGLPGNPVSSLVCFELFVRAALDAMQGVAPRPRLRARLATPVRRLATRDHAVRCRLVPAADGVELHAQDAQESHLIVHA